jgi:hypothetical protein
LEKATLTSRRVPQSLRLSWQTSEMQRRTTTKLEGYFGISGISGKPEVFSQGTDFDHVWVLER